MSGPAAELERLGAAMLDRALAARSPGRRLHAVEPCSPLDAFVAAAAQLGETLEAIDDSGWAAPAHPVHGTVGDLVAHLVGVEELVAGWLEAPPGTDAQPTEHVAATRAAVDELAGRDRVEVVGRWRAAVEAVVRRCEHVPTDRAVLVHDLPTDVDGLLVLRAFELWAHLLDICEATGRRDPVVDEARLALMSTRLMDAVPLAVAWRGVDVSGSVRMVLTGPGGGCRDVDLRPASDASPNSGLASSDGPNGGARSGASTAGSVSSPGGAATGGAATVVADAEAVCRVAARRLQADRLDAVIEGDRDLAVAVLGALDAFAKD